MYLGDLWIAPEEVEQIVWREGQLVLDLRWRFEELPVLFGLLEKLVLRWHEEDPGAGLSLQLVRWQFRSDRDALRLFFRC